jgi:hypothetical protein
LKDVIDINRQRKTDLINELRVIAKEASDPEKKQAREIKQLNKKDPALVALLLEIGKQGDEVKAGTRKEIDPALLAKLGKLSK